MINKMTESSMESTVGKFQIESLRTQILDIFLFIIFNQT